MLNLAVRKVTAKLQQVKQTVNGGNHFSEDFTIYDFLSKLSRYKAAPWLRRLAAGLPPRRPGFDPGSVHVGYVVDKVALGQVFPRELRFSPVNFIPPVLHY
jgi:hypothetical protein